MSTADANLDIDNARAIRLTHELQFVRERAANTQSLVLNILRSLLIAHGGAIVAILTLLGSLDVANRDLVSTTGVLTALGCFGGGIILTLLVGGAAMLASDCFAAAASQRADAIFRILRGVEVAGPDWSPGEKLNVAGIWIAIGAQVAGLVCVALFGVGALVAIDGLRGAIGLP